MQELVNVIVDVLYRPEYLFQPTGRIDDVDVQRRRIDAGRSAQRTVEILFSFTSDKSTKVSAKLLPVVRFLQLCENHSRDLQNFLRIQLNTTAELGLLGLYINNRNVALINQTLETLTEYQGPCHENRRTQGQTQLLEFGLASEQENGGRRRRI